MAVQIRAFPDNWWRNLERSLVVALKWWSYFAVGDRFKDRRHGFATKAIKNLKKCKIKWNTVRNLGWQLLWPTSTNQERQQEVVVHVNAKTRLQVQFLFWFCGVDWLHMLMQRARITPCINVCRSLWFSKQSSYSLHTSYLMLLLLGL